MIFAGLMGWLFASTIYAVNFWAGLLVLRYYEVIDDIIPYQGCFVLAALINLTLVYDRAIRLKK